jgi:hypothetical protein
MTLGCVNRGFVSARWSTFRLQNDIVVQKQLVHTPEAMYDIARAFCGGFDRPHVEAAILSRGQRVAHPEQHNMATRKLTVRLFLWESQLPALVLNEGSKLGVKQNYGLLSSFCRLHLVFCFVPSH